MCKDNNFNIIQAKKYIFFTLFQDDFGGFLTLFQDFAVRSIYKKK